jgi:Putative beta barrel porin-7 (BBP7)
LVLVPQLGFSYYVCHPCCWSCRSAAGWWLSADYLLLWRKKRFYPPLVTTNPAAMPILTDPATTVLFGNKNIGRSPQSGGILDLGIWLTRCLGFGGGFLLVAHENVHFVAKSPAGTPILGRPFFNEQTGAASAQLIGFPIIATKGQVNVQTKNKLWDFDLYARYRFLNFCLFKFDLIGGYFSAGVDDNLDIATSANLVITGGGTDIRRVADHFHVSNHFNAGLIGVMAECRSCNWGATFSGKVGLGNMVQKVVIDGRTSDTIGGVTTMKHAGLLAQPSNIGRHSSHKFEVVTELEAKLQLRVWGPLWLTTGYACLFFPSVALAGDQVNLNVNPSQLPGPTVGPIAPIFVQQNRNFWAQGVTAGIYIFY